MNLIIGLTPWMEDALDNHLFGIAFCKLEHAAASLAIGKLQVVVSPGGAVTASSERAPTSACERRLRASPIARSGPSRQADGRFRGKASRPDHGKTMADGFRLVMGLAILPRRRRARRLRGRTVPRPRKRQATNVLMRRCRRSACRESTRNWQPHEPRGLRMFKPGFGRSGKRRASGDLSSGRPVLTDAGLSLREADHLCGSHVVPRLGVARDQCILSS